MWKRLSHPNILSLLGITVAPLQLISNWMSGGDLPEYLKKNPDADRLSLVGSHHIASIPPHSCNQLSDVARGLCYLHSCNVVHGDLKGVRGCTAFCFTTVLTRLAERPRGRRRHRAHRGFWPRYGYSRPGFHTKRLSSPRPLCTVGRTGGLKRRDIYQGSGRLLLCNGYDRGTSQITYDVLSYGLRMSRTPQVFTGAIPFIDGSPAKVRLAIMQGKRPPRPIHPIFTGDLWILMQRCWDHRPDVRPVVSEILQVLLTPSVFRSSRLSYVRQLDPFSCAVKPQPGNN